VPGQLPLNHCTGDVALAVGLAVALLQGALVMPLVAQGLVECTDRPCQVPLTLLSWLSLVAAGCAGDAAGGSGPGRMH
jgi:hypothetical protein